MSVYSKSPVINSFNRIAKKFPTNAKPFHKETNFN